MIPLLIALLPHAEACGGFFCSSVNQPVDQAAERILFVPNADAGTVEMHVQITYSGSAEQFAWLLPVPNDPTIATGVDDVFTALSNLTFPRWNLTTTVEGTCYEPPSFGFATADFSISAGDEAPRDADDVSVVGEGSVGPYETVKLTATNADALITWLNDHDYYVPADSASKLAPYLGNSIFVGLRLQKGRDVGDLVPVVLSWTASDLTIPLQLTAIAAQPDLRLQPYVLGEARAVPLNYLHVQVNELAIDWLQAGVNYPNVITRAADEAGGHGFATDYAQPTDGLAGTFWADGRAAADDVIGSDDSASEVTRRFQRAGFPISTGTVPFLRRFVSATDSDEVAAANGVSEVQLFSCLDCFSGTSTWTIDDEGLAAALDAEWIPVMERAEAALDRAPWLTRLTSSISAEEMNVDPSFVVNADMGPVDNQHNAEMIIECGASAHTFQRAPRRIVLSDGRELWIPEEVTSGEVPYTDFIETVAANATDLIEETSAAGEPVLVRDNRPEIDAALAALNEQTQKCGCDGTGTVGASWAAGLLALGLARRRR